MKFISSPYYNKKFLGEYLYKKINNDDYIFTIQEYFGLHHNSKEYHIKDEGQDYNLKVYEDHYELDCQKYDNYLFLIFDKPVHITGSECGGIIAPEIIINSNQNSFLLYCFSDKVIINKYSKKQVYMIDSSKVNNIYFYEHEVHFKYSEVNNFFVFNQNLYFYNSSKFLNYHKIKCVGPCRDLKKKLLNNDEFRKGIIHIE